MAHGEIPMDEQSRARHIGGEATTETEASDTRPCLEFDEANLPAILDKIQEILIAKGAPLFQRSGRLVHAYRLDRDTENGDTVRPKTAAPLMREIGRPRLRGYM